MVKIYATKDPSISDREKKHMKLSRTLADECIVLMENDGTLPLLNLKSVALYGNGARRTVISGTGSGEVNARENVSVESGLEKAGIKVLTKGWLESQERYHREKELEYYSWVVKGAKENNTSEPEFAFFNPFYVPAPTKIEKEDLFEGEADAAIFVIARCAGEGQDRYNKRGDYQLYAEEKEQLEMLSTIYEKLIVVINTGALIDMSEIKNIKGINAVVLMGQLGNVGGDVLTDIITGKVNPSGKLVDSWAEKYEDYPSSEGFSHNDNNVDDEYYTEGIYVGYRYFDSFNKKVLYPFGYGLSYTSFSIKTKDIKLNENNVCISVEVENTEIFPEKKSFRFIIQLQTGKLKKPYQELVAFAKTKLLSPNEKEVLEICFNVEKMSSYSEELAAWILETGNYILRVGNSSLNTDIAAVLVLDKDVITEKNTNLFKDDVDLDEMTAPAIENADDIKASLKNVIHINMDSSKIKLREISYTKEHKLLETEIKEKLTYEDIKTGKCSVEDLVAQLTIEEMADMCVGTFRGGDGPVVGVASSVIPGAAGDSSSILKETRNIKNMILSDGPAGLRLQPEFKMTKDGRIIPDEIADKISENQLEEIDTYYQSCTAIPIGWSLAQSWNTEMLEEIGFMIGTEMELFGIDIWLAPALNIHRNPLCGRNFEYFSEDPFISGKVAAAIIKGVQKHPFRGATVKHFAANSQEENRYFSNAHISERALREIYLKGFEIAIKEARPMAIMSSYNLVNGIHTANSKDLIQFVARDEWGFDGFVMTDWFTSQERRNLYGGYIEIYPISASTGCIFAGNDLQMPGCQKNVEDIIEAVKTGKEKDGFRITLADLQFCAMNMIKTVMKLTDEE